MGMDQLCVQKYLFRASNVVLIHLLTKKNRSNGIKILNCIYGGVTAPAYNAHRYVLQCPGLSRDGPAFSCLQGCP